MLKEKEGNGSKPPPLYHPPVLLPSSGKSVLQKWLLALREVRGAIARDWKRHLKVTLPLLIVLQNYWHLDGKDARK